MSVMGSMESMYRTKYLPCFVPRLSYILSCTLVLLPVVESHDCTISHMKHDVIDNAEVTSSVLIFMHTIYALALAVLF